jgi:hypothetical protein
VAAEIEALIAAAVVAAMAAVLARDPADETGLKVLQSADYTDSRESRTAAAAVVVDGGIVPDTAAVGTVRSAKDPPEKCRASGRTVRNRTADWYTGEKTGCGVYGRPKAEAGDVTCAANVSSLIFRVRLSYR